MAPQQTGAAGVASLEEGFVKVSFEDEALNAGKEGHSSAYKDWIENSSGKRSAPGVFGTDLLRKLYPDQSLVCTQDWSLNVLGFPGAYAIPINPSETITNVVYRPLSRRYGEIPGILLDSVEFGCFKVAWERYEFTLYVVKYMDGPYLQRVQNYILHEGPEDPARALLRLAGAYANELHEEIWVFNQGFWRKDHALWEQVQLADWDDVILKKERKAAIQKDVTSFFKSEALYKELGIPWKRGLIMYGPPGNGKAISLKAIMKDVQAAGHLPLYVKSFQSWMGEEGAMQEVFGKARQEAPCVVILEDLDSLINDRNRSFFLNQLDGIEGNDGLLIIGTTNHFDRLDAGLSSRPSRFDRKYLYDDPERDERMLYCKYWQGKLKNNDAVEFPDSLAVEITDLTYSFSFAYLKEAFVSTLVLMIDERKGDSFANVIKGQIKDLRKQLDKPQPSIIYTPRHVEYRTFITPQSPPKPNHLEVARASMAQTVSPLAGRTYIA